MFFIIACIFHSGIGLFALLFFSIISFVLETVLVKTPYGQARYIEIKASSLLWNIFIASGFQPRLAWSTFAACIPSLPRPLPFVTRKNLGSLEIQARRRGRIITFIAIIATVNATMNSLHFL